MPYIDPELIEQAKQIDLLTYLQMFEPYELVKVSSRVYSTRTHDSLKISNGKWMWWSRGIGGRSALDYLIKVREMDFMDAVEVLLSQIPASYRLVERPVNEEKKILILPQKNRNNHTAVSYLMHRGISRKLIDYCIENEMIYEDAHYHNVIFVGYDERGESKYGAYRATRANRVMGDCSGSDKRYSFRLVNEQSEKLHVFESAIDLLSYATLIGENGGDWRAASLLSLSGIYAPEDENQPMKTPVALEYYLKEHPQVKRIILHLDNDRTGRVAAGKIRENLSGEYEVTDDPPLVGKDFNDTLLSLRAEQGDSWQRRENRIKDREER